MSSDRHILEITGTDARSFLQGLVTNDVDKLDQGLVYAALLTPQGKYLADFFMVPAGDAILIDVDRSLAEMLKMRLTMYKLRADVAISDAPLHLQRGLGPAPEGAFADPRDASLGWRAYRPDPAPKDDTDWDALNIAAAIPTSGIELTSDSFILEMGFERLNGVDFRKGCYVGQEVTARMKHKTEVRKGLALLSIEGNVTSGAAIERDGKTIGRIGTVGRSHALAHIRFDRMGDGATADGVAVAITG